MAVHGSKLTHKALWPLDSGTSPFLATQILVIAVYGSKLTRKALWPLDSGTSPFLATQILVIAASGELFWIDFSQYCTYPFYVSTLTQGYRDGPPQPAGLQHFQARQ